MCSPSGRLQLAGAFHVVLCILGRITVRVIRFKLITIFFFFLPPLQPQLSCTYVKAVTTRAKDIQLHFHRRGGRRKKTSDNISSIVPILALQRCVFFCLTTAMSWRPCYTVTSQYITRGLIDFFFIIFFFLLNLKMRVSSQEQICTVHGPSLTVKSSRLRR